MVYALKIPQKYLFSASCLFLVCSLVSCSFFKSETSQRPQQQPAWKGLLDNASFLDLKTVTAEKLKGKIVFVNFWASWCPPCQEEMPGLFKMARSHSDKIAVLAVSQDSNLTEAKKWIDLFPKNSKSGVYLLSDEKHQWERTFKVTKLPETFIFDPQGKLLLKLEGSFDFEGPEIQKIISMKTD